MRTSKVSKSSTEQDIISKFIEGDTDAFALLFNQYWKTVYSLSFKYTRSHSDAEDVSQEVFKNIWERRDVLDVHTNFENYLIRSAKNRILNYFRARQTKEHHENNVALANDHCEQMLGTDFLLQAERHHQELITFLSPKSREIYKLKYHQSLTNQSVADQMGISVKTVEYHLQQAKKVIRSGVIRKTEFL